MHQPPARPHRLSNEKPRLFLNFKQWKFAGDRPATFPASANFENN
jgi:hypothetical protein